MGPLKWPIWTYVSQSPFKPILTLKIKKTTYFVINLLRENDLDDKRSKWMIFDLNPPPKIQGIHRDLGDF